MRINIRRGGNKKQGFSILFFFSIFQITKVGGSVNQSIILLNNIKLLTSTFPITIILFMGPNQTKSISMGPIWNTGGTETVISVPVSVLGPERAASEMGCIPLRYGITEIP